LALVGAGGKSTALFQLARQLPPPVIVTATTHLSIEQQSLADQYQVLTTPSDLEAYHPRNQRGVLLFTGGPADQGRTEGLQGETLAALKTMADENGLPLLIEADGSRQLPLKAPALHEPPIPLWADTVAVVAGLTGLGTPLDGEHVHRHEIYAKVSGLAPGSMISPEAVARVLVNPDGGLKNIPLMARKVAILNQADTIEQQAQADWIARRLLPHYPAVVVASLEQCVVHKVHERVAGVILAAGKSKRLGRPKQVLEWQGEPFIRQVARTALAAGLSPVIVVTGAASQEVDQALVGLPVLQIFNPNWEQGQSTSIKTGLAYIPDETGAVVFMLVDQPQVTREVIQALVSAHSRTLDGIVAPEVDGQRANPVLFDQDIIPELLKLEGDVGGRAVFSNHHVTMIPWDDPKLLLDVDTPEDYQRLLEFK
jgi:molybdenum cofactor cytidylyltransferase